MDSVDVRPIEQRDAAVWERMRCALWPGSDDDHARDIRRFFAGARREPAAVFIADDGDATVGFIELSIRPYAEGCTTDHVAYIEGWYVDPSVRRRGVGRALARMAEEWGRSQGCRELASDAALDNEVSADAHRAIGFEEVGQIRCFRKPLS